MDSYCVACSRIYRQDRLMSLMTDSRLRVSVLVFISFIMSSKTNRQCKKHTKSDKLICKTSIKFKLAAGVD